MKIETRLKKMEELKKKHNESLKETLLYLFLQSNQIQRCDMFPCLRANDYIHPWRFGSFLWRVASWLLLRE